VSDPGDLNFYGPEASATLQDQLDKRLDSADNEVEEAAIKAQKQQLDKFFADRVQAKYKIEIQFGKGRSTWKHFPGAVSLYLSGTKLNGGGDEKLYLCPHPHCGGIIYPNERLGATVMCRKCNTMIPEQQLVGELLFRLAPPDWAKVIHKYYIELGHNADIYCKYHRDDIRYQAAMELARAQGGEAVNKSRNTRGLHIYPLKNIIRDTSNGGDLYERILAFIKS
jgi:hypothetical protein